ncbi:DsbA family protein [Alkalimarinus coralli]|uniref:DsbA family protein n=1 Tax=Alkalimarinus coralli TaxID=2935863 RepID=UPI00202B9427|nr:DsbA family protein [Alkalimarinus coralli]
MLKKMMFALLMIVALSGGVSANELMASNSFEQGRHYEVLDTPISTGAAPVMEFFYYGCRTCYQLVPAIAEWSHKTGIGVSLVPAHSESTLVKAARLHHTFAEMGVLATMYELGYVIFQTEESTLQGAERIDDYLSRHNVDKERFWQVWESDAVNKRMAGSLALTRQAKVFKTPAFVVQGRYVVDIESITSVDQLFELLSYLAEKPRDK